jgi:hypothetical protein
MRRSISGYPAAASARSGGSPNGVIPKRYELEETTGVEYAERARKNVEAADATVGFSYGPPTGGSAFTVTCAETVGRPFLAVDLNASSAFAACLLLDKFVQGYRPRTSGKSIAASDWMTRENCAERVSSGGTNMGALEGPEHAIDTAFRHQGMTDVFPRPVETGRPRAAPPPRVFEGRTVAEAAE